MNLKKISIEPEPMNGKLKLKLTYEDDAYVYYYQDGHLKCFNTMNNAMHFVSVSHKKLHKYASTYYHIAIKPKNPRVEIQA